MLDKISHYLEIGLFHRIPEIGEKNPACEATFKGYKRQKIYLNDTTGVNFSCTDNAGYTAMAAAVLDRNNVVIDVIYFSYNDLTAQTFTLNFD